MAGATARILQVQAPQTPYAPGQRPAASAQAEALAGLAVSAIAEEARLSPKPGLVDSRGNGAHADLTLPLMLRSAHALGPSFAAMADAGLQAPRVGYGLREQLGALGREAEAVMLSATGGVNTHRGAIWCIGLLVGAAAHASTAGLGAGAGSISATAGAIASLADRHRPVLTGNKGELACLAYGVGGARAQARAGFPHVTRLALPALRRSRARGEPESTARLNALLALMSELDDTCVLARSGRPGLDFMQAGARAVLLAGGAGTVAGRRHLRSLDAGMLARRASPGGAADLLAATIFLDRLSQDRTAGVTAAKTAEKSGFRGL
ncbi:putative 2-(5''-triphosphoribosyl)-3'-dephosphocoenzyme-A synthase [Cupriavidus taiwanensis]|uniref:Probable 2-(5''-triphosphoribosyl)-3'-dephosphocoenzyme-A synthase n=1 Tax=Cupriavidus taiwanensis TaxID=164546 RepID=A0A375I9V7_9BURK|nr:triphosphoribosyl-dephospho-CoA synthase [Cupriavidus taiwanensis]SPK70289.1 putative 2-(5''-triphosphoribosyl)-3'-dephosphocoenzyme-A synthase [Cupriavidus taiwanensis]SPK72613.1 putative 2-(5''-triphosphoribosyl)-3'-dephosphocoenzyme-A synthase [Cupriavidus taiwanensis]